MATWSPYIDLDTGTADLGSGEVKLMKLNGTKYWAIRLNPAQKSQLEAVDKWTYPVPYCDSSYSVCLVAVDTQRQGILIREAITKPKQLSREEAWVGGFINPANGAVYDLMGRGYRSNSVNALQSISVDLK